MKILTIYAADAFKLLGVLDDLTTKNGIIKVLASDPSRLFNNNTTEVDVQMASITFMSNADLEDIQIFIDKDDVFVCDEDPSDW